MSFDLFGFVFGSDSDFSADDLVRLLDDGSSQADDVVVHVDPVLADSHAVGLDHHGFPTVESLQAWHQANNPHLFD